MSNSYYYRVEMCRYAYHTYKTHFACFSCRKTFKKAPIEDWAKQKGLDLALKNIPYADNYEIQKKAKEKYGMTRREIWRLYVDDMSTCPQCGEAMGAMGLDFKAPKLDDVEAWKVISILHAHEFSFGGCGCGVGYEAPKKLNELEAFFQKHEKRTEGLKLLEKIGKQST